MRVTSSGFQAEVCATWLKAQTDVEETRETWQSTLTYISCKARPQLIQVLGLRVEIGAQGLGFTAWFWKAERILRRVRSLGSEIGSQKHGLKFSPGGYTILALIVIYNSL